MSRPLPNRVFASSRFNIDKILGRPYTSETPFGSTGNRIWASSPQGWAFANDVQLLEVTGTSVFDLDIRSGPHRFVVNRAEYSPSHVKMIGGLGTGLKATASFTYKLDKVSNPLTKPFTPAKRWTSWSSGKRTDWFKVEFGAERQMRAVDLYFFDDLPTGECSVPAGVDAEVLRGDVWTPVAVDNKQFTKGKNRITFKNGETITAEAVRFTFHHKGKIFYTGLYGVDPDFADPAQSIPPPKIGVTGHKWIAQNDILVSQITLHNLSSEPKPFKAQMESPFAVDENGFSGKYDLRGHALHFAISGQSRSKRGTHFEGKLRAGETRTILFAAAVADSQTLAEAALNRMLAAKRPLEHQIAEYQGWFDKNIAYFNCSDARVNKMYYHRWYTLKKNAMDPKIGTLQHKAFAEGRWRVSWYPYPITYGAAHQIRESRWLRDPSYCWGEIQTWMDNQRADGIYPGRLEINGDRELIYTDWITSAVWDAYQVHPSKGLLTNLADKLAANVEGLQKKYGWNDSNLLVMPTHWLTGMEYQPSYFSFTSYHADNDANQTPLRRVDFTSYNFGNAQAVASIYKEVGRPDDARHMQALANKSQFETISQMWNPETKWFHSLRASDYEKAVPKEIIGLYPFYFNLPPSDKGFESAWDSAMSKDLFWTKWPLASVAKDCPVYAQQGWPIGKSFASACMWNGPSWPHANSIVMIAMANVLRYYAKCAVTREKLYELFDSFTRVQYRNGEINNPWTGEYYNGDTGEWKTGERDYNHSTYNDILIGDLIGIVPRADNILEIDPLLPKGKWDHYILDGQEYRKHNITIVYDAKGGRYKAGLKGYTIYLDGKQIHRSDTPKRLLFDLSTGLAVKSNRKS
ncbi:MAG: glycosyl hydrolase family 65 protein [Chthonomonadales bacterium]